MTDLKEEKKYSVYFRPALYVGLWWGFFETILLVWGSQTAYFTWGRYLLAWGIITFSSIVIILLISVPLSRLPGLRGRSEAAWAAALFVPLTWITAVKVTFKVVSPATRWEPSFLLDLWYIPLIFIGWCVVIFVLLLNLARIFIKWRTGAVHKAVTAILGVLVLLSPVIFGPSYSGGHSERKDFPDIILLTLDTVRADHMATYGYFRQTTPFLDKLAQDSVVFDNAAVQIPYTTGSHISMLTSRYPSEIGISKVGAQFDPKHTTLTKILKNNNYLTAAFISSFVLDRAFTRSLNFDVYDDVYSFRLWLARSNIFILLEATPFSGFLPGSLAVNDQRRADAVTSSAIQWLGHCPQNRPLFLWVHYFDPHFPLDPPPPFNREFQTTPALNSFLNKRANLEVWETKLKFKPEMIFQENNLYDGELAFMDHWIEQLFGSLEERRNRLKNAYVFVISDHGFSLSEHYYFGKVSQLYDPVVRIPFFIRLPDGKKRRIHDQVEAIDLMPTVLDLLGLDSPPETRGRSLVPLIKGKQLEPRPAFSESLAYPVKYSARTPQWKLIYNTRAKQPFELYKLTEDPLELKNLAKQKDYMNHPAVKKLMRQLGQWIRKYHKGKEVKMAPLTPGDIEKLRSLGYIE